MKPRKPSQRKPPSGSDQNTAWDSFGKWYDKIVGDEGHYYHRQIILPGVLRLLELKAGQSILDLACGQGILAGALPKGVRYVGVDASESLISSARKSRPKPAEFYLADVSEKLLLSGSSTHDKFDAASILLAIQNIKNADGVIKNAKTWIKPGGHFILVINHPSFRVPRQSSWGIDSENKMQYRRVQRYMTPMEIPMQVHPGRGRQSPTMWAFHRPLSFYMSLLQNHGFCTLTIEEWVSDKTSVGGNARMENRAREEFPLFMALLCKAL